VRPFESILDDWRDWPLAGRPAVLKRFVEGLNHDTALLAAGPDQYVLKRFLSEPARQIESQLWAATLGISPGVIFAPPNHQYMLMQALSGSHFEAEEIDNLGLRAVARSLSTMHAAKPGPRSQQGFDIRQFCQRYLSESDDNAMALHDELMPVLDYFYNDPTPWVFCHNDLVKANCFIQNGEAQFIDWEYADLHNPWFDLAAIVYYFDLDSDQSRTFLAAYQNDWQAKVEEPIFLAAQISLLWGDMLWHLDKFGGGYWPELAQKEQDLRLLALQMAI
jgi:tRNA A-37 threonylcarbamoyl transferase component Bud32